MPAVTPLGGRAGSRQDWARAQGALGEWARHTGERPELRGAEGLAGAPAAAKPLCSQCGRQDVPAGLGRYGVGTHDGMFFCSDCWRLWQTGARSTLTAEDCRRLNEEMLRGCEVASRAGHRFTLAPRWPLSGTAGPAAVPRSDGLVGHYRAAAAAATIAPAAKAASSLAWAEEQFLAGEAGEALAAANTALEAFRGLGDHAAAADAVRLVVQVHGSWGATDAARSLLDRELESCRRLGSRRAEGRLLLALAGLEAAVRGPRPAAELASEAQALLKACSDERAASLALLQLSHWRRELHELQAAVAAADEAFASFERLGDAWGAAHALAALAAALSLAAGPAAADAEADGDSGGTAVGAAADAVDTDGGEVEACALARRASDASLERFRALSLGSEEGAELTRLAAVHLAAGCSRQAAELADVAGRRCREWWHGPGEAAALHLAAEARLSLGEASETEEWATEARGYFKQCGDGPSEALVLFVLASLRCAQQRFGDALACTKEAVEVCSMLGHKPLEAAMADAAARILLRCRRATDALAECRRAAALCRGCGDILGEAHARHTISRAHSMLDQQDEALAEAKAAVEVFRLGGLCGAEAEVLLEVAYARGCSGALNLAAKDTAKAKSLFQKVGDKRGEAAAWLTLADAHLPSGKLDAARWSQKNAARIAKDLGDQRLLAEASTLAGQLEALEMERRARPFAGLERYVHEPVHRSYLTPDS